MLGIFKKIIKIHANMISPNIYLHNKFSLTVTNCTHNKIDKRYICEKNTVKYKKNKKNIENRNKTIKNIQISKNIEKN